MNVISIEQLAAKAALDIMTATSDQVKLSLLQDLLIILLPNVMISREKRYELYEVRCHANSENVTDWLDRMLSVYINFDSTKASLSTIPRECLLSDILELMEGTSIGLGHAGQYDHQ